MSRYGAKGSSCLMVPDVDGDDLLANWGMILPFASNLIDSAGRGDSGDYVIHAREDASFI